jgi:polar amino acid transport system permease protein
MPADRPGSEQALAAAPSQSAGPAGLDVRNATRRKHPVRWAAALVVLVLVAQFVNMLVTNDNLGWPVVAKWLTAESIMRGLGVTLVLTVIAMVIGIVLGVLLAVCRLSANPLLRSVSGAYIWFFGERPRWSS